MFPPSLLLLLQLARAGVCEHDGEVPPRATSAEQAALGMQVATALIQTGQLDDAERELCALVAAGDHPYHDQAQWQLLMVRNQRLIGRYGSVDALPPDAQVERRVTLPSGQERLIYALDEDHRRFIAVADALVAATFTDPEYAAALDAYRAQLAYLPAVILVHFGRFDEARPRLNHIQSAWPGTEEAAFSEHLLVDTYAREENLALVRAHIAWCSIPGPRASVDPCPTCPREIPERLAWQAAEALTPSDRAAAAAAFLAYVEDYPHSPRVKDALYNAGNSYEVLGRVTEADQVWERYTQDYPNDERSAWLLFRAAWNASAVLDLERAIRAYETLVQTFPTHPDAPAARYNASFLRIGLGDHAGAGKGFERYAVAFPAQHDAEQVLFQAGYCWERVSRTAAIQFYQRYLRSPLATNPDHRVEAAWRLAVLTEQTGDARATAAAWTQLADTAQRLAGADALSATGRYYAAQADLHALGQAAATLRTWTWRGVAAEDLALLQRRQQALARLAEDAARVRDRWQDFEGTSAAFTLLGEAQYLYADRLAALPSPEAANGALKDGAAEDLVRAAEAEARASLEAVLALAAAERRWTAWQDQARAALARHAPLDYPPVHTELRAVYQGDVTPSAGPLSVAGTPAPPTASSPPADPGSG